MLAHLQEAARRGVLSSPLPHTHVRESARLGTPRGHCDEAVVRGERHAGDGLGVVGEAPLLPGRRNKGKGREREERERERGREYVCVLTGALV